MSTSFTLNVTGNKKVKDQVRTLFHRMFRDILMFLNIAGRYELRIKNQIGGHNAPRFRLISSVPENPLRLSIRPGDNSTNHACELLLPENANLEAVFRQMGIVPIDGKLPQKKSSVRQNRSIVPAFAPASKPAPAQQKQELEVPDDDTVRRERVLQQAKALDLFTPGHIGWGEYGAMTRVDGELAKLWLSHVEDSTKASQDTESIFGWGIVAFDDQGKMICGHEYLRTIIQQNEKSQLTRILLNVDRTKLPVLPKPQVKTSVSATATEPSLEEYKWIGDLLIRYLTTSDVLIKLMGSALIIAAKYVQRPIIERFVEVLSVGTTNNEEELAAVALRRTIDNGRFHRDDERTKILRLKLALHAFAEKRPLQRIRIDNATPDPYPLRS